LALVNTVMKFQVYKKGGGEGDCIFLTRGIAVNVNVMHLAVLCSYLALSSLL